MTIDLKLDENTNTKFANIFKLSTGNKTDRLPEAFLRPKTNRLMVTMSGASRCISKDMGTEWFTLELSQYKKEGKFISEIKVDNEVQCTKVTTSARVWKNVKVEIASDKTGSAKGQFQNFRLKTINDGCKSTFCRVISITVIFRLTAIWTDVKDLI